MFVEDGAGDRVAVVVETGFGVWVGINVGEDVTVTGAEEAEQAERLKINTSEPTNQKISFKKEFLVSMMTNPPSTIRCLASVYPATLCAVFKDIFRLSISKPG